MGTATVAMLLVTSALRGVIGHLTIVMNEPLPDVDVLRYATAANYALVDGPLMSVLALTILAVAILVLREGLLAPWVGYTGLVAAVILVTVAVQFGGVGIPVANVWMIGLGVALAPPGVLGRAQRAATARQVGPLGSRSRSRRSPRRTHRTRVLRCARARRSRSARVACHAW